jgi:hypothetical protein
MRRRSIRTVANPQPRSRGCVPPPGAPSSVATPWMPAVLPRPPRGRAGDARSRQPDGHAGLVPRPHDATAQLSLVRAGLAAARSEPRRMSASLDQRSELVFRRNPPRRRRRRRQQSHRAQRPVLRDPRPAAQLSATPRWQRCRPAAAARAAQSRRARQRVAQARSRPRVQVARRNRRVEHCLRSHSSSRRACGARHPSAHFIGAEPDRRTSRRAAQYRPLVSTRDWKRETNLIVEATTTSPASLRLVTGRSDARDGEDARDVIRRHATASPGYRNHVRLSRMSGVVRRV